ncbi:MAG: co-chaperone GroES [Planctomycetes bacterium]|nr:co-chaperone GroES [Planctomycetota bacterium]
MSKKVEKVGIDPEGCIVVVKPDVVEERTSGGLFIPDTVRDTHQRVATTGTIVALGPDVEIVFNKGEAEVGDCVHFVKHAGVNAAETDYWFMRDEDILGLRV